MTSFEEKIDSRFNSQFILDAADFILKKIRKLLILAN